MAADEEGHRRIIQQTNALVRALIEQETLDHPFWISGIVSRFYLSHLGHMYFDLVDDNYSISCMVRQKIRGTLDFTITNNLELTFMVRCAYLRIRHKFKSRLRKRG
jgi:exonuclease VII large subunit